LFLFLKEKYPLIFSFRLCFIWLFELINIHYILLVNKFTSAREDGSYDLPWLDQERNSQRKVIDSENRLQPHQNE